jgi:Kef-type K+ transport system membrane component KefB
VEQNFAIAAQWVFLALIATVFSIRLGISVALMEIAVGVLGGSLINLEITSWVNFLAGFGAVVLTFLVGAEINPDSLKNNLTEKSVNRKLNLSS